MFSYVVVIIYVLCSGANSADVTNQISNFGIASVQTESISNVSNVLTVSTVSSVSTNNDASCHCKSDQMDKSRIVTNEPTRQYAIPEKTSQNTNTPNTDFGDAILWSVFIFVWLSAAATFSNPNPY
jgi:hypothetical protein